jgi:hypothetical protein
MSRRINLPEERIMKSFIPSTVRTRLLMTLGIVVTGQALAQSSGNFTYSSTGNTVNCQLADNGTISGGYTCANSGGTLPTPPNGGQCLGSFTTSIKTSSGAGNLFDIRPSMVIGLLTDVSITKTTQSSSALAGVNVGVTVDGGAKVMPNFPITYDARYVQISSNLFNALTQSCVTTSTTPGDGCFFNFSQSTVSAHSFDWLATNLNSGTYNVTMQWAATNSGTGNFAALTCVGPVNVTVQQNKVFHFDSPNSL